ncbi:MAG: hypothetical protein CMA64_07950, partial [Euryarchaeota archaeon]|nr:hypothetical protein [Euryarchaeota archaeon]
MADGKRDPLRIVGKKLDFYLHVTFRDTMERLGSVDEVVDRYAVENSSLKSKLYVGLGSMFVIFAIAGIWIPGWPTVSWAVPAAFLFSLSSRRLFRWSLTNRFFGPAIFDYYASG